jgi:predicted transcriptional regulator YdeE
MKPEIVTWEKTFLIGMSFFGDPFKSAASWDSDNEIGNLWNRFFTYVESDRNEITGIKVPDTALEIHIEAPDTAERGNFEVYVGMIVETLDTIPIHCVAKTLPPCTYAVFTLRGEEIHTDWWNVIYSKWLPGSGYEISGNYNFQLYDKRFRGMDKLSESEIDVYVPVKKTGSGR